MYEQAEQSESQNNNAIKYLSIISSVEQKLKTYINLHSVGMNAQELKESFFGLSNNSPSLTEAGRALAFLNDVAKGSVEITNPETDNCKHPAEQNEIRYIHELSQKIYSMKFHLEKLTLDKDLTALFGNFFETILAEFTQDIQNIQDTSFCLSDFFYMTHVYEKRKDTIQKKLKLLITQYKLTSDNYNNLLKYFLDVTSDRIAQIIIIDAFYCYIIAPTLENSWEYSNSERKLFLKQMSEYTKSGYDSAAKWLTSSVSHNEFSLDDCFFFVNKSLFTSLQSKELVSFFSKLINYVITNFSVSEIISRIGFLLDDKEASHLIIMLSSTLVSSLETFLEYSCSPSQDTNHEKSENDNTAFEMKKREVRGLLHCVRLTTASSWQKITTDPKCPSIVRDSDQICSMDENIQDYYRVIRNMNILVSLKKQPCSYFFSHPFDVLANIASFTQQGSLTKEEAMSTATKEFQRLTAK